MAKARARDTQRKRLYEAEHAAWLEVCQADPKLNALNKDRTIEEAQKIVHGLADRKRIRDRYPISPLHRVQVDRGINGGVARRWNWSISLGVWARRTHYVILHEVAHLLAPGGVAAHGWEFAEANLFLWRQVYGVEAAKTLEASYRRHRVRYRKPRARRELTPEQRAAAVERLAAARAARTPSPWVIEAGAKLCPCRDYYWGQCPDHPVEVSA